MTLVDIAIGVAVLAIIALPARYDPAIRLKEWLEKKRHDRPKL